MAGATIDTNDLVFRIVADDMIGTVSDSAVITTQWVDQVGSLASSASTVAGSSGDAIFTEDATGNGHAGVLFDGTDGSLLDFALSFPATVPTFCLVVATAISPGSASRFCVMGHNSGTNRQAWAYQRSASPGKHACFQVGKGNGSQTAESSTPTAGELEVFGADISGGFVHHVYDDGTGEYVAGASSYHEQDAQTATNGASFNALVVGGADTDVTRFGGYIHEVIIYDASKGVSAINTIAKAVAAYYAGASTTPPDTPTVTIDQENETSVDASTSEFSAGEGGSHTGTQWRIREKDSQTVVYNPGDDATNLTSITGAGSGVPLTPDFDYEISARHEEDNTTYSEWSAWVDFSTTFGTAIRYVPVALGDTIVVAGKFVMEGGSDTTQGFVRLLWHRLNKTTITTDTPIEWNGDDGRKQATVSVQQVFIFGQGFETPRFISWRLQATGNAGETCGFDYVCAWRNPPAFNLSASISLDGSDNVDLEWESSVPCRVKYVANTTGYVSSAEVEENGTFTESDEFTSDTEEDIISTLSGTAYVTMVPYDMNDKRSGPRYLVPTVTN